jgi:hypothetical protein
MTGLFRLVLCTLGVGIVCAGVCCLRPQLAVALGLDVWNLPELEARLEAERVRLAALDGAGADVLRRLDARQQVADAVIDGRLGLLEAAARFRDLTPADEATRHCLQAVYPGVSDNERFCRAVIGWVRGTVRERAPAEAHRRAARLEAELEGYLRRDGRVALPR